MLIPNALRMHSLEGISQPLSRTVTRFVTRDVHVQDDDSNERINDKVNGSAICRSLKHSKYAGINGLIITRKMAFISVTHILYTGLVNKIPSGVAPTFAAFQNACSPAQL